jgi:hypothetical protein
VSQKGDVRRLAAILVVDAADYSALMRVDETATHRQIKADVAAIFTPILLNTAISSSREISLPTSMPPTPTAAW